MVQKTIEWPEEDSTDTVVLTCCRECDMEIQASQIDAEKLGWARFCFEGDLSWVWFDFSAVCPECGKQ